MFHDPVSPLASKELDISELEYPVESVYFELVQFWKNETRLAVSSETEERNSLMFLL